MKKQSFILSAIILALGGFFAKAIGALYKIPSYEKIEFFISNSDGSKVMPLIAVFSVSATR